MSRDPFVRLGRNYQELDERGCAVDDTVLPIGCGDLLDQLRIPVRKCGDSLTLNHCPTISRGPRRLLSQVCRTQVGWQDQASAARREAAGGSLPLATRFPRHVPNIAAPCIDSATAQRTAPSDD